MYYVIQCRFSEFLIQLCIENAFFLGPCRNITTTCVDIYSRIAHIDHRGEIMHQWYTWEILLEMLHFKLCHQ